MSSLAWSEDVKRNLGSEKDGWKLQISPSGIITDFQFYQNDTLHSIPFRTDKWGGSSWYVRTKDGSTHSVALSAVKEDDLAFSGFYDDIRFSICYEKRDGKPVIKVSATNEGTEIFQPMTAGIRLGVDSYQEKYPNWNNKLIPNVMRCERTHHWGFAMSPKGSILGWICPTPVASYSINFMPNRHRIYTPNIDLINQLPLPDHHPQHLTGIMPGETKSWTIYLTTIDSEDQIKADLSELADAPIFDADYYTVAPDQETQISILGPKVSDLYIRLPKKLYG